MRLHGPVVSSTSDEAVTQLLLLLWPLLDSLTQLVCMTGLLKSCNNTATESVLA
jgi:hypothetical protein